MIRYRGYYISKGIVEEEWHAGIRMKYKVFSAFLFCKDGGVLVASTRVNIELDNYCFKKQEFKRSRSLSFFNIDDGELSIFRKDKSFYQKFIIKNREILVDEFGFNFSYVLWGCEDE